MANKIPEDFGKLSKEEKRFITDRKLKDKYFIGCFTKTKTGYQVSDIRRSDFSKIKYKPRKGDSFTITVDEHISAIRHNQAYYRFTWVMLETTPAYVFGVDTSSEVTLVRPHDIVDLLYEDIYDYPASASEKIVNTLDTLKNQLTASGKEVFIYELLQNANDYPQIKNGKKLPVDVEFHITDNYLVFQHSGDYFDAKNIAAICSINDKEKTNNSEAIGYKGIGFKTVFLDNNYVLLRTGEYQFRFDYEHTKDIEDTPWQILPIWTENKNVSQEVLDVMDSADKKYRVQIALRPAEPDILHDGEQNYEELFDEVFDTERVILFIPYINSVSVFMDGDDEPSIVRIKDNDKWCVSEPKRYVGDIESELTEDLNRRIDKNDGKIPEKYYNFTKTSVGFACKREGRKLLPVENSCLYCYLPAKKAKLGFSFLMNTDMIPTGPRDNVEPKEKINHAIAKIAGEQFYHWIHDLLESNQYDYDSIFSLIPDFEACKEKYEDDEDVVKFIEEFQEGFETCLDEGDIVPVEEDGKVILAPLAKINYDEIGITCADIISDQKLLEITDWTDFFPHPSLRDYENQCLKPGISAFLNKYAHDNCLLDLDCILDACENESFQEWLSDQDTNNSFLEFLLNKDFILRFKDKKIFKTEEDYLFESDCMYEDIDIYYPSIKAFDDYLPRLSVATRSYFEDNEKWQDVHEDLFDTFNPDTFVDDVLLSDDIINETIEKLKDKETSIGFFDFLAKYVGYSNNYKELPVFDFKDNVIENFNEPLFFYHEDGEELYDAAWSDSNWIRLISQDYSDDAIKYFEEQFEIEEFSIQQFVDNILYTEDVREYINGLGEEHKDFVYYCFEHKDCFPSGALKNYALWTYDKDEKNDRILSEDVIFFPSPLLDSYQEKTWIKNGWMYQLDQYYFDGFDDSKGLSEFLSEVFGVKEFSQEAFYDDVISSHIDDICKSVGGTSTESDTRESIDVLTYLGENYKLIFEENNGDRFIHLPLYRYDTWDKVIDRDVDVYMHDDELQEVIEASWAPGDFVYMLEDTYDEVFEKFPSLKKKLEIKTYTFRNIKDVLLDDIESINDCIENKEQNVAFHRFMLEHYDDLTKSDFKELSKVDIYAVDNDGEETPYEIDGSLYISDCYMDAGKGIEAMVKKYDSEAYFISSAYLDTEAENPQEEPWHDYFINLGISSDIKDIIFNSVLPNLSEIRDRNIVSLLANYYDYFHAEGEWEQRLMQLKNINVVVKGGDDTYLPLKDVLFNDCYKSEPFPYLVIEDEIAQSYHQSADVMRLLREIIDGSKTDKPNKYRSFKTVEDWKKEKLEWYLKCQKDDIDELEPIHVRFIQDLATDYSSAGDTYSKQKVREIQLLDKKGKYHKPDELTEGTVYKPRCNFEKYMLPLDYLSECYLPFEDPDAMVFRDLFKDMGVIYDIQKSHYKLMAENYDFTVYFWKEYLATYSNRTHINAIGTKELNDFATIPTNNSERKEVKKPNQLYRKSLIQGGYVEKKVNDYKDKMPLEDIFSTDEVKKILDDLDFLNVLSFEDCLTCLLNTKDKAKRRDILSWLASKNYVDKELVNNYLDDENSVWRNGRGDFICLKDLIVLDIEEDRLKQLFGKNAKVLSSEYMETSYVFEAFCRIFEITALTEEDFELTPVTYDEPTTEVMRQRLRLPLLLVAAVSDSDNWEELYNDYCEKLDKLTFYRCKSISLNYKDILVDSSIQYHKSGEVLYFVDDWMGRRVFKDLVFDLVEYFDIDMDNNMLEGIFEADEKNQSDIIERYVSYELTEDATFIETLRTLNNHIAEGVQSQIKVEEDNDEPASTFGNHTQEEVYDAVDDEISYSEGEEQETSTDTPPEDVNIEDMEDQFDSLDEDETPEYGEASEDMEDETEDETDDEDESDDEPDDEEDGDDVDEDYSHELEAPNQDGFIEIKQEYVDYNGTSEYVVCEHYRSGTWVRGHVRNGYWVNGYWRGGSNVSSHSRTGEYTLTNQIESHITRTEPARHHAESSNYEIPDEYNDGSEDETEYPINKDTNVEVDNDPTEDYGHYTHGGTSSVRRTQNRERKYQPYQHNPNYDPLDEIAESKLKETFDTDDADADERELAHSEELFSKGLSREEIADQNTLVKTRMFNSFAEHGYELDMNEVDFIRHGGNETEYDVQTKSGAYIHVVSAYNGIMYLSPMFWNRVQRKNCVICIILPEIWTTAKDLLSSQKNF
jgi:hypothetical protein